jgi:hypothetical protein
MTGDGSIISNGLRVTHGFNLNCDVTHNPQRLQINWDDSRFHLESLASANCSNDPNINAGQPYAGFNTYTGSGTGTLDGVDGATIDFVFTDAGEPGTKGHGSVHDPRCRWQPGPESASGNLDNGNEQAHKP